LKLGFCYATGRGVAKNEKEAAKWFRKAAAQNHAGAQYNLSLCYLNGIGVEKDEVEGSKWMLLAAGQGDEQAKQFMTKLENEMTREQIAEAQKRARDFKPSETTSSGG